jgi:hypothetical protein
MKKYILIAMLFIVGGVVALGLNVNATEDDPATVTTEFTLEEMLVLALEDEWNAYVTYEAIIETYGEIRPFTKIIFAEATHAALLTPLFDTYGITLPDMPNVEDVIVPASLEEAYALGVEAEIANIALYEAFLLQDVPEDVVAVFEQLIAGSVHHLAAFERSLARETGVTVCDGKGFPTSNDSANTGKKGPQYKGGK